MQPVTHPIVKDLVLIGGGHTHAIALRMLGMNQLPGLRITLITDTSHTPYSGMLPGHVAGYYDFDECHIDLRHLAQFAQAQLYIDRAVGLDLKNNKVLCANHPPVAFDVLSIDIGSTPAKVDVPGAAQYAIPAKPVPQFLQHWNQFVEDFANNPQQPMHLGIVGGGAGGVELALTMQGRLHQILQAKEHPQQEQPQIHLFQRGAQLMPNHNSWVRRHLYNLLMNRGVQVHLEETVSEVLPDKIHCESGLQVECDYTFWVTNASAPQWIEESGLKTDSDGFILVGDTLQSLSHPHIFAAGDIATMVNHPRPKAGVFAVRQGKPLFENLTAFLLEKPLKPYKPQQQFLGLIGTGDGEAKDASTPRSAIASWGALCWQSPLLWRWKDYIDRKFMQRFSDLSPMGNGQEHKIPNSKSILPLVSNSLFLSSPINKGGVRGVKEGSPNPTMRCAGCGSKVGSSTLERVLQRLQLQTPNWTQREDILIGLGTPDDAAVIQVPAGQVMVQSIDYFPALLSDPYIFGQISTHHGLSDIFAMGATPQSALAMVSVPYASEDKVEETLYQLLSGAMNVLYQAQAQLIGGHTTEGAELAFGLACNGLAAPEKLLKKGGMQPGQVLILTKALGTGTLFAADMRLQVKGRWIDQAVHSMLLSNQEAANVFVEYGATACTDITGFGLLGHLMEMVKASGVAVELDLEAIPVLEGALETLEKGIMSSLQPQNLRASYYINNLPEVSTSPKYPLLFDPQTSGGLLAAVPAGQADLCLATLQARGYAQSRIVGCVIPRVEEVKPVAIATI
ncbi:selenide, water dikinase SelD [Allocoleopsis franciscana]|uniref:Selenophosphate synthase n=1 Tax=Allocoleopsis franciscana PCC 7113 TaxID=1173027 RepID=K9WNX3_9CYAN|nr:selenide, water dikinase SelD [Allocoleopsis franciscana]AFZ21484.1 selenophosphate synthase [Allocoleopsis franciscana PCC 7113]